MLTQEQKATNDDTWTHIHRVQELLNVCIKQLMDRGLQHDQSKLQSPEVELFTEYGHKLKEITYGSEEYKECLEKMKPALDHHYANNSHHPEFHKSGIDDMSLLDLIEMFCDWKAASERQYNGNLRKSIESNANRFNMSPQLIKIFENTIKNID